MDGTENFTIPPFDREADILNITIQCYDNPAYKITFACVMFGCVCPAIFGNILIITSYIKFPFFHGMSMYKYILNMAISDLIMGCSLLMYATGILYREVERYKYFCILRFTLVLFSVVSSSLFITLISIDRFLAVVFPFRHMVKSRMSRNIWIVTIVTWIISLALSFHSLVFNTLDSFDAYDPNLPCVNSEVYSAGIYAIVDSVILVVLFVDFILYAIILRTILKSPVNKNTRMIKAVAKTKLVIIIHATFVVCWLPFVFINIVFHNTRDSASGTLICTREYLIALGIIQSCTNCIYYGMWNDHFRRAFRKLLCCCRNTNETIVIGTIS